MGGPGFIQSVNHKFNQEYSETGKGGTVRPSVVNEKTKNKYVLRFS